MPKLPYVVVGGVEGASVGDLVVVAVGAAVSHSQLCPGVVQSPSEQWWVLTQPHRWPAPPPICSQIPNTVPSQPWLPSVCEGAAARPQESASG